MRFSWNHSMTILEPYSKFHDDKKNRYIYPVIVKCLCASFPTRYDFCFGNDEKGSWNMFSLSFVTIVCAWCSIWFLGSRKLSWCSRLRYSNFQRIFSLNSAKRKYSPNILSWKKYCWGEIDWDGVGAYRINVSNWYGFYHEHFLVIPASCEYSFRLIKWIVNSLCTYMSCLFILPSWCTILLHRGLIAHSVIAWYSINCITKCKIVNGKRLIQ